MTTIIYIPEEPVAIMIENAIIKLTNMPTMKAMARAGCGMTTMA